MAYDSVFKRVEKKYRTTPRQRAAVEAAACDTGAMAVGLVLMLSQMRLL